MREGVQCELVDASGSAVEMGAVVQWQDRQYLGSLWGQSQHSPHILTTNCQHKTHIILVPLFPNYYPTKYQYIAHDYKYYHSKHVDCGQSVGWMLSG